MYINLIGVWDGNRRTCYRRLRSEIQLYVDTVQLEYIRSYYLGPTEVLNTMTYSCISALMYKCSNVLVF